MAKPSLKGVVGKLTSGERGRALADLVAVWRTKRAPELAVLIHTLGETVTPRSTDGEATASAERTAKARQAAWLERAAKADTADVDPLISVLLDRVNSTQAAERLQAMQAWPDDPRVAARLGAIAAKPPFQAGTTRPFWDALFPLLARHGDPRTLAELAPLSDGYVALVGAKTMGQHMKEALDAALATLRERFVAPPELDEADRAVVAELRPLIETKEQRAAAQAKSVAGRDEASLLGAVFARPDDDAPRAVYADWLQEKGDPRGEFIAHQLRGDKPKGEATFIAKHKKTLLGRLARALTNVEIERGFVVAAKLAEQARVLNEALGLPEWSTLTRLSARETYYFSDRDIAALAAVLWQPALSLREFSGGDSRLVEALATRALPELRRVATHCHHVNGRAMYDALARWAPNLREVVLAGDAKVERALFAHPLATRLEHAELVLSLRDLDEWIAPLEAAPPSLRITGTGLSWRIDVQRKSGRVALVARQVSTTSDFAVRELLFGLQDLAPGSLSAFTFDQPLVECLERGLVVAQFERLGLASDSLVG